MRLAFPLLLWAPATLVALALVLTLYATSFPPPPTDTGTISGIHTSTVVEAEEEVQPTPLLAPFEVTLVASDARSTIIASFLKTYQCPLTPYDHYADVFVEAADTYNLDFRLLPAISMQESNCCKRIPEGSNNCWGYGIYGDQVVRFPSFEEGIHVVAKTLSKNYSAKGLLEPDEIMRKYTPQSKGSWAAGVLTFMNQMK